jgi:RNA polymerase sigma factor (sigma-70 family)
VARSDGELLAESRRSPEAFADIVRRHSSAVHGYLARRAGRQIADELLGEVWLRAFRSRHTYNTQFLDARPWLYGIARNTLRAHWRLDRLDGTGEAELIEDPWPDADARLDAREQGPALRDALIALDADDREVLLLVAWERLTPAEVAVSLGMPSGTVRWRLHRARKQLQKRLDDSALRNSLDVRSKEV